MPHHKKRRQFTEEELKKIESMYARDLAEQHICTLMDIADGYYDELLKKTPALRRAKKSGKAKASLKVKTKLWEKIESGEMKAIELYMKSKEGYTTTEKLEISGPNGGPQVIAYIPENGSEVVSTEKKGD